MTEVRPRATADEPGLSITQGASHLDQLIRQTRVHHVQLSMMADTKANILITVSAIIVPLTLRYLDSDLLKPAAIAMIGFSILTICLAAYAVMPKGWRRRPRSAEAARSNLLFFGDFTRLDYDEYIAELDRVFETPARAYEAQAREIYLLGQYLCRQKYRYLRYAYMAFIAGMVTSGLLASAMTVYHYWSAR